MNIDKQGGIEYHDPEELKRAKSADLVTLPIQLQKGINCGNCKFYQKVNDHVGFCAHVKVQLPVTDSQCCSYQDTPGMIRSWEHKGQPG